MEDHCLPEEAPAGRRGPACRGGVACRGAPQLLVPDGPGLGGVGCRAGKSGLNWAGLGSLGASGRLCMLVGVRFSGTGPGAAPALS